MRGVIWFIVVIAFLTLFAQGCKLARDSLNKTVERCQQHNAEVLDVR